MRYFQHVAAATLMMSGALIANPASAATLITAAGTLIQRFTPEGGPYDDVPEGTLSIRGLGNGIAGSGSYTENVEFAGTGFFAGMTGLGSFSATNGFGSSNTANLVIGLASTIPDQFGFIYRVDFLNPRRVSYSYDQVFSEEMTLGDSFSFATVLFRTFNGDQVISSRPISSSYSVLSNNSVPFVPIAPVTPAVPEPATWAMMIVGLGAVGYSMRRRQKITARVTFA